MLACRALQYIEPIRPLRTVDICSVVSSTVIMINVVRMVRSIIGKLKAAGRHYSSVRASGRAFTRLLVSFIWLQNSASMVFPSVVVLAPTCPSSYWSTDEEVFEYKVLSLHSFTKHDVADVGLSNDLVPIALIKLPEDERCPCTLDDYTDIPHLCRRRC